VTLGMNNEQLLALLREFYNATLNDDSTCCFGCGCVDVERLRQNADVFGGPENLECEVAAMHPEDYTHKPDCIIQRARAVLEANT
jgi:hypothetical protein